jgi:6-phosphogluconolactonase
METALTALLFIGTYSRVEVFVNGRGEGIYTLVLNKTDGTFSNLKAYPEGGVNPTYLTLSNNGKFLYAVNENSDSLTSSGNNKSGAVLSFRVDKYQKDRKLTLVNSQVSEGTSPCHVRTDKTDSVVYVSNYGSGTVAVYPIESSTGALARVSDIKWNEGGGSGVVAGSQDVSRYHCMIESPNNEFVLEADLGADKIMQYKLDTKTVDTLITAIISIL